MRFAVELWPAAGGRVEGSVECDGTQGPVAFSGWLELLRLLEADVAATSTHPRPEP